MDDQHAAAAEASGDAAGESKARLSEWKTAAGDALDQAKAAAQDIGTRVQDAARQAQDKARATRDALHEQGSQAKDYVVRSVEQRPLAALLVAGAIGYAVAYLIHRR
jgi:ElaB/YqjD/DUF883 family membrane-anchored ribosome-binding protein